MGQIVGYFYDPGTGRWHGFLDTAGIFTTLDVPGSSETFVIGINNAGQIVGFFDDATNARHGFLATPEPHVSTVPEPSSVLMLGTGLIGLAFWTRRRRVAESRAVKRESC